MVSRLKFGLAFTTGLLVSTAGWAAPSGQMLAQTCAACHGTGGSSVALTPSIAGMDAEHFVETMTEFKTGERRGTVMDRVAKGYSEAELERMARYFASQPFIPMQQDYSPEKARRGAGLHEEYCEKCHEDGGTKPEDSAILAGQSKVYLQYSMVDFQEQHRIAPKKMRKRVKKVLEEYGQDGLDAIIHYYVSQQ